MEGTYGGRWRYGGRLVRAAAQQVGGLEQFGVGAELAGRAGEADLAALHDVGVVGQAEGDGGELLDEQHAGAGLGDGAR